jgi:hypothetical protein
VASNALFLDQAAVAEDTKLLRDPGSRDPERARQLVHGPVAVAEQLEQLPACGVGDRLIDVNHRSAFAPGP